MDILDILLDILLKPPQPFIGLFFDSFMKGKMSCTLTLVCMSAGVYRDQRYLNNQIIFIHLRFIIFSYLYTRGLGARVGVLVCGGMFPTCLDMHTHACIFMKNTCSGISNGHHHGGIHVYHV